jgi:archaellum component FlaC
LEEHKKNVNQITQSIRAIDNEIEKITQQIDQKAGVRATLRTGTQDSLKVLQAVQKKVNGIQAEVDKVNRQIQNADAVWTQQYAPPLSFSLASLLSHLPCSCFLTRRAKLQEQRKNLRFSSVEDLDDRIKQIEMALSTSTYDLNTEKKLLLEIKLLKSQRDSTETYSNDEKKLDSQMPVVDTKTLRAERSKKAGEARALRTERDTLESEFKGHREKEQAVDKEIQALVLKRRQKNVDRRTLQNNLKVCSCCLVPMFAFGLDSFLIGVSSLLSFLS